MELTVSMLDWMLQKRYSTQLSESLLDRKITQIVLGQRSPLSSGVLQILEFSSRNDAALSITIVQTGQTKPSGWTLYCDENERLDAVNYIFSCFHQYLSWREEMRIQSSVHCDIEKLIDLTGQFLNVNLLLIGQTHEVLAQSNQSDDLHQEELLNLLHIRNPQKDELIEDLYIHDPEFDRTFQTEGLMHYQYAALQNHKIYYANIHLDEVYLARILWLVRSEYQHSGFIRFLELTTPMIDHCYHMKYARELQTKQNDQLNRVIKGLFSGVFLPEEEISHSLKQLGWNIHDCYQIIVLQTAGYIHSEQTLNYYAAQLSTNYTSILALVIGDCICCIRNLQVSEIKDFRKSLSFFLRENLFRAGFSEVFEDLMNCKRGYEHATAVLRLGKREHPELWRYDFAEYLYEYIMELIAEEISIERICPPGLQRIRQYDIQKPTAQLEKTLRTYLACHFNATEAAAKLFIHRTTFLYRMNKIEQISGLSLSNWKDVVMLMLAFSVAS